MRPGNPGPTNPQGAAHEHDTLRRRAGQRRADTPLEQKLEATLRALIAFRGTDDRGHERTWYGPDYRTAAVVLAQAATSRPLIDDDLVDEQLREHVASLNDATLAFGIEGWERDAAGAARTLDYARRQLRAGLAEQSRRAAAQTGG